LTKVLIAEDVHTSLEAARKLLQQEGFEVQTVRSLAEVSRVAFRFQPRLILLEVDLPSVEVCQTCLLLREFYDGLIVVLGGASAESAIVRVFEKGADDYLTQPIGAHELRARVHAHLRRTPIRPGTGKLPYIDNGLHIDLKRRRVLKHGKLVVLSPTEYELLSCLLRYRGEVVPHGKLLSEALGDLVHSDLKYLKVYVWRLREKLEDDPAHPVYIVNYRSIGYAFNPS
jgi:DNA-binding response OmpR family regulator